MAFHTNVFRGGEWVTQTVDLHAVLKLQAAPKAPMKHSPSKGPTCGLLTRTVVESALANSILPVRLRCAENNDVAFVGVSLPGSLVRRCSLAANILHQDRFVQICELRENGRLDEIIRKNDFGCRIRNACVVGSFIIPDLKDEGSPVSSSRPAIKIEDGGPGLFGLSPPRPSSPSAQLPPQFLMVVLESGDSVFLFVRPGPDGKPEFVTTGSGSPRIRNPYPGFHLAIDPSSRYVALAGATDYFVVYELESHERLNQRYLGNEPLNPVRSLHMRSVRGVIHKITFLHPRPGDHHHIILLLVLIRNGQSRTVIYEWELESNLESVFAEEKYGHRLPVEHRMPLLLIPLTAQSAFLFITRDRLTVCTGCLHGPPKFENYPLAADVRPTVDHHGRGQPLWTAWARALRLQSFRKHRDCIFLAREDGVVVFIDLDQVDVGSVNRMDTFPCSISRAFACLFDPCTDVLMMGSESGPGGYWKVREPRRSPCIKTDTLGRYRLGNPLSYLDPFRIGHQLSTSQPRTTSRSGTTRIWYHGSRANYGNQTASFPPAREAEAEPVQSQSTDTA